MNVALAPSLPGYPLRISRLSWAGEEVLSLEIIRTVERMRELEPWWDRLLEQSATRTPFLRWDWVSLWWEECRGTAELAVVVVRGRSGIPCAIAPLMIDHGDSTMSRPLRQLAFLGGLGSVCGQRLDFMVPRGREPQLTPILCKGLRTLECQWDRVRLNRLPAESPNLPHIMSALKKYGIGIGVLTRHPCRLLTIPASWNDYEQKQSGAWRSKFRRRWKSLTGELGGRPLLAGADAPADKVTEALFELHRHHWPDGVSEFTTPESLRFHRRLAPRWIEEGRAWMPYLEVNGKPAAVIYGLIEGDEFFQYQMGWDPAYQKISPGKLAMRWCVERCIAAGLRVLDLLPGEFAYKEEWSDHQREVLDLEAFRESSLRGFLFRAFRCAKRKTMRWLKN